MQSLQVIPLLNLSVILVPVLFVAGLMFRWSLGGGTTLYSVARMLAQLLLIGYVLTWIFTSTESWIVLAVLAVMLLAASWIALRPLKHKSTESFARALAAIALGGISTLAVVIVFVLELDPWFSPHMVIPLGGMIFANAMNSVSIAAERFESEIAERGYQAARNVAMNGAMIPQINIMLAVGLVSLPGTMTGQILAGVSPLIAVRYQIMVMCMIFGSAGIAVAYYLWSLRKTRLDSREWPEPGSS